MQVKRLLNKQTFQNAENLIKFFFFCLKPRKSREVFYFVNKLDYYLFTSHTEQLSKERKKKSNKKQFRVLLD
jgi:hypothetical protein